MDPLTILIIFIAVPAGVAIIGGIFELAVLGFSLWTAHKDRKASEKTADATQELVELKKQSAKQNVQQQNMNSNDRQRLNMKNEDFFDFSKSQFAQTQDGNKKIPEAGKKYLEDGQGKASKRER